MLTPYDGHGIIYDPNPKLGVYSTIHLHFFYYGLPFISAIYLYYIVDESNGFTLFLIGGCKGADRIVAIWDGDCAWV